MKPLTDKEAFNEFAKGATFVIVVMGVFVLFLGLIGNHEAKPEKKFEVVDKYEECSVVRYTDRSNTWHYFLDCRKGG
jgi:hypothetical protein